MTAERVGAETVFGLEHPSWRVTTQQGNTWWVIDNPARGCYDGVQFPHIVEAMYQHVGMNVILAESEGAPCPYHQVEPRDGAVFTAWGRSGSGMPPGLLEMLANGADWMPEQPRDEDFEGQSTFETPEDAAVASYSPGAEATVVSVEMVNDWFARIVVDTVPSHPMDVTCLRLPSGRWVEG